MSLKRRLQIIIVALTFLASMATFASDVIYSTDKTNITIESAHPEFTIKLKSNPTTGYSWFLREYNHNLITPIKHRYQEPTTQLIGASGYEFWTFRVNPAAFIVPQQMVIRFVYTRPWEGVDNSTQAVFRISTVKK